MVENARMRKLERIERVRLDLIPRRRDFVGAYPDRARLHIETVIAARQVDQCCIPLLAHARNNGGDRLVHVGGLLALHRKQGLEAFGKVGIAGLEPQGHGETLRRPRRRARRRQTCA